MEARRESPESSDGLHHLCSETGGGAPSRWNKGGGGLLFCLLLLYSTITATLKALNCWNLSTERKRRVHLSQRRPGSACLLPYRAQLDRLLPHLLADDTQTDKLSISGRGHEAEYPRLCADTVYRRINDPESRTHPLVPSSPETSLGLNRSLRSGLTRGL